MNVLAFDISKASTGICHMSKDHGILAIGSVKFIHSKQWELEIEKFIKLS